MTRKITVPRSSKASGDNTTKVVTVEEINGQVMTVVWHDMLYANGKIFQEAAKKDEWWRKLNVGYAFFAPSKLHIATALPPLPRHPKPESAPLLYRYMAEGLLLKGVIELFDGDEKETVISEWVHHLDANTPKITHAIDSRTGERVDVAITDKEQSEL